MTDNVPKNTARMERFAQIVAGVTRGDADAALAYTIYTNTYVLNHSTSKDEGALDMVRTELCDAFAQVVAKRDTQDLGASPYFADISRVLRRQGAWGEAKANHGSILEALENLSEEFTAVDRSNFIITTPRRRKRSARPAADINEASAAPG